jgi:hypothetical protein
MVDWLTWPADLLLSAGGILAGWFASKDTPSYTALQMALQCWCWRLSYP